MELHQLYGVNRHGDDWIADVKAEVDSSHACNAAGYWYLGSPYSLCDDHDEAAATVARAAASLMADGHVVYSPIAHGHAVSTQGDLPQTWEFWKAQCQPLIDAAHGLIVLRMEGWRDSAGLAYEIECFAEAGKPIHYMDVAPPAEHPDDHYPEYDREASRADREYQFRKEQEVA